MTKAKVVERVWEQVGNLTKRDTKIIVDTVFDTMKASLFRGEKIEIRGFGSFKVKMRGARAGRNPKTGKLVAVPPKKTLYFKVGKSLKEKVNS